MMFGPRVVLRDPPTTTTLLLRALLCLLCVCTKNASQMHKFVCVCVSELYSVMLGRGGGKGELHELMQQHERGRATAMVTSKASQPQRRRVFQLNSTRQTTAAPATSTSDSVDRGQRQTSSIRHAGCQRRRLSLCSGVASCLCSCCEWSLLC